MQMHLFVTKSSPQHLSQRHNIWSSLGVLMERFNLKNAGWNDELPHLAIDDLANDR